MRALAFDVGATHCRVALVSATGYESIATNGANAFTDPEAASQAIISSVHGLAEKVNISPDELIALPTFMGVAGVINQDVANALNKRLPFKKIRIEEDRMNALRGALGVRDGFLVHCGTGSFFAKQRHSAATFSGGWGPVLDDIASANWVGVQALQAALYAEDGLQAHTQLTSTLLSDYEGSGGIVTFANRAKASEMGSIAKVVTECAQQDDETAVRILQQGAALIAEKLSLFSWTQNDLVCLTGGVARYYKRYFPTVLQQCIVDASGEPLDGAVALAREFYAAVETT